MQNAAAPRSGCLKLQPRSPAAFSWPRRSQARRDLWRELGGKPGGDRL